MSNKLRKHLNKAKKSGLTNVDVLRMRETARKEALKMENVAIEKAFLYMLAIPLNVLAYDYWQKSAKKRMPGFIKEVCSLYEAVQNGNVSDRELADLLEDMAGIKIEAAWLEAKKEGPTC